MKPYKLDHKDDLHKLQTICPAGIKRINDICIWDIETLYSAVYAYEMPKGQKRRTKPDDVWVNWMNTEILNLEYGFTALDVVAEMEQHLNSQRIKEIQTYIAPRYGMGAMPNE